MWSPVTPVVLKGLGESKEGFFVLFCLFGVWVFCETYMKPHKNNFLHVWMRLNIIYTYTKKIKIITGENKSQFSTPSIIS